MNFDDATHESRMLLYFIPGLGQVLVGCGAVILWHVFSGTGAGWFLAGALLWAVAVALKMLCARAANKPVLEFLHTRLPYSLFVMVGGLFTGVQSSLFEMGITILAVMMWQSLGESAAHAVAVGIGAGAIEALLLGAYVLVAGVADLTGHGVPAQEENGARQTGPTALAWLVAPFERVLALACHASCRTSILLGMVHGNHAMIFPGIAIFTLLDGVAGGAHISGKLNTLSLWWIELMMTPFALAGILLLMWCFEKYG